MVRFSEKVGFTEAQKDKRLKHVLHSLAPSRVSRREEWPVKATFLGLVDDYRDTVRLPRSVVGAALRYRKRDSESVAVGPLSSLLTTLVETKDYRVTRLTQLLGRFRVDPIATVVAVGPAHVRDIEVSGDHEYEAGGLLSHNCEKTADVITTTYLNDDLRRNGMTKFTNLKNRDNPIVAPFLARVDFTCRRILTADKFSGATMSAEEHEDVLTAMNLSL
jgi:hypothetical protein